jgi:hypothetical protein
MLTPRTTATVDTVFHPRYVRLIQARRVVARFCPSGVIQGRVIFGTGRSDQTCEVETFGASLSGPEANRTLFEEQSEVTQKR